MKRLLDLFVIGCATVTATIGTAFAADNVPYVVRGNTHMLIGVTLNEAAVREALPEGLEPAEGMSGGFQVYNSGGGGDVAAYSRSYVWVNLAGYDSITGNPGRFILWLSDTEHAAKMAKIGYATVEGAVALSEADGTLDGTVAVNGAKLATGSVKAGECGAGTGVINYPSMPAWSDKMAVTQYAFAGKFCGAELTSLEISAPTDHMLSKLDPQPAGWAAVARELSFSATPAMTLPAKPD